MDAVTAQQKSQLDPFDKQVSQEHSKLRNLGFAVLIILSIGALGGAACGVIGLASSQAQWIVSIVSQEGCLILAIGGGILGTGGIGVSIYHLKKPAPEEQKPNIDNKDSAVSLTDNEIFTNLVPGNKYVYVTVDAVHNRVNLYWKGVYESAEKRKNIPLEDAKVTARNLGPLYTEVLQKDLVKPPDFLVKSY